MESTSATTPPSATADARTPTTVRYLTLGAGWGLLACGAVLLVLPGPGLALILGGLALLGREVAWARRLRGRIESAVARRLRRRGPELRAP